MWINPSLFAKMPARWRCFKIIKGPDNKRLFFLSISFAPKMLKLRNFSFPPPTTYYSLTHTHTHAYMHFLIASLSFRSFLVVTVQTKYISYLLVLLFFLYKNIYVKFNHLLKVIAFENVELSFFKRSQPLFDT